MREYPNWAQPNGGKTTRGKNCRALPKTREKTVRRVTALIVGGAAYESRVSTIGQ
jgi:hypothetical protein